MYLSRKIACLNQIDFLPLSSSFADFVIIY